MTSKIPTTGMFKSITSKLSNFFSRPETPRQMQERKDLYMALLASTYKSLRRSQHPTLSSSSSSSSKTNMIPQTLLTLTKQEKQRLIDEATQSLEDRLIHQMTIMELRSCLQIDMVPELQTLFQAFSNVEDQLRLHPPTSTSTSTSSSSPTNIQGLSKWNKRPKDDAIMKPLLLQEFETLSEDLMTTDHHHPNNNSLSLTVTKLGAIKTILDYKGWLDPSSSHIPLTTPIHPSSSPASPTMDEFGYYSMENHNIEIQQIMRTNQLYNLTNAHLLKQQLGYTTIALRSTIPNAGRGIYIDGHAPAGTIVSFFPGDVWPRDYLQTPSIASHFEKDDSFQLSLRYDDILVDSRKSPAVVLDTDGSNPWALAHLANHPPKPNNRIHNHRTTTPANHPPSADIPNCRPLAMNYTSEMNLSKELKKFIPNRYARKPSMLGYNEAFERQDVVMHGLVLVTTRDVENEELFYDYRFSPPGTTASTSTATATSTATTNNNNGGLNFGMNLDGNDTNGDNKDSGDDAGKDRNVMKYPDWYHVCDEEGMKNRWG